MASYITGVTDYIPQVQPWSPNFNFYQSVLERKQAKYDMGWERVNSVYNSILNAPMMREGNITKRDNFFQNLEGEMKRMASVDLSLEQNVNAASEIFKPFYEDDYIIRDIGFTKKYSDELQTAEAFRQCMDKECKGKYWQGGVRALQHQAQDFMNADDETSLRMRNPEYTPYVNMMEKATAAAKEAGLSIKVDSKEGGYIVTTKNGAELQMPLMNYLMQRFGDDPEFQQFYRTKAYLLTKEDPEMANRMYQESLNNPGMRPEEAKKTAEQNFLMDSYDNSRQVIQNSKEKEENRFMALVKKRSVIENTIRQSGMIPGSDEANEFMQLVSDVDTQDKIVNNLTTATQDIANIQSGIQESGLVGNEDHMRAIIANAMQIQDTYGAASVLAYKDYERTMEADPFAMENQRFQHSVQLAQMKQQWTMQNKATDYFFDKTLKQLEVGVKDGTIDALGNGHWMRGSASIMDAMRGGITPGGSQGSTVEGADNLATQILSGMTDPYSQVTQNPGVVQKLLQQGDHAGALEYLATGNRSQITQQIRAEAPKLLVSTKDAGKPVTLLEGITDVLDSDLDKSHTKMMREKFTNVRSITQSLIEANKSIIKEAGSTYNKTYLNTLLGKASDEGDPESGKAQLEFLDLGTHVKNRLLTFQEKNGKDYLNNYNNYSRLASHDWAKLPQLTEEEFSLIKKMPTHTSNGKNANADFFRKFSNSFTSEKITQLAGGDERLYNFLSNSKGTWIKDPKSGKIIDKKSAGIVDDMAYGIMKSKLDKEAGSPFTKSLLVTPETREAVNKYERFQGAETFEKNHGIGSKINSVQAYNMSREALDIKKNINVAKEANKSAIKTWNQGLINAQDEIARSFTAGAAGNAPMDDRVINLVKKNIIKKDGDLWRLATDAEMTSAIAESFDELGIEQTTGRARTGFTGGSTIFDIENDYAKDGMLTTKAKLNLISKSMEHVRSFSGDGITDLRSDEAKAVGPNYARESNKFVKAIAAYKFEEDNKLPPNARKYGSLQEALNETLKENPYNRRPGTHPEATEYMSRQIDVRAHDFFQWLGKYEGALETKYSDKGKRWEVLPSEKYNSVFGRTPDSEKTKLSFNLNDTKVPKDFANIITDYSTSIAVAHKEFLTEFGDEKSPFGGYFGGKGMGSFTAPATTLQGVTSTKKDQNYHDSIELFKEAITKGNFKDDINKGAIQALLTDMERGDIPKGKTPYFDLKVRPVHGSFDNARYTLTFTDKGWEKYKGYNKVMSEKGKGNVVTNPLPESISWQVKSPTDPLTSSLKPSTYDMLLGNLETGQSWVDNSAQDTYGSIFFDKINDEAIQIGYNIPIFNPATGKEEVRKIVGDQVPFYGTNWTVRHQELFQGMLAIKEESNRTKAAYMLMNGSTDPAAIQEWYNQQGIKR